jgi:hypothetical protein
MKKLISILFVLLSFFALLIPTGCGDNNDEDLSLLEPAQRILGKWQEIARGNDMFPELEPDGHVIEFLADGTYHAFLISGDVSTRSYRIDAEFVYYDGGTPPGGHTYRYSFTGTDTLRLDYVSGNKTDSTGTPRFNIFKRIKNK